MMNGRIFENNAQNIELFPGWSWRDVQIRDTQSPSVSWIEVDGATPPGVEPQSSGHYVVQMVVKDEKIMREFKIELLLSEDPE